MAGNYEDVLAQLQGAGLLVDNLHVTGRVVRCRTADGGKEKRGWYVLHEVRMTGGDELIVGTYGEWRGAENHACKVEITASAISKEQREAFKRQLAEDKKRAEAARKAEVARAAKAAAEAWAKCSAEGESAYLTKKAVRGHGVRYSPQGALVIPMLGIDSRIKGLQIIRSQPGAQLGKQFWPAGLEMKGAFHQIGMAGPIVLVAEGYATGASLHEATTLPVVVAFTANNLLPVVEALAKRHPKTQFLICADDDDTQKCQACKQRVWVSDGPACPHCGKPHNAGNAGVTSASTAAMRCGGAWVAPAFADPAARRTAWLEQGTKLNDFNDLHVTEGLHLVRSQIENRITELGWRAAARPAPAAQKGGEGDSGEPAPLRPFESLDELLERFSLVYGHGGAVFDHAEHSLVSLSDMRDACRRREIHRDWMESEHRRIVRVDEVGFDPTERDPAIKCNLWSGWPTRPKAGECSMLLELLAHMCKGEANADELYRWMLCWLAYPLQHPGAKMKTTVVLHGPQGTGKNMFFEAYMSIFGKYGRVIDQTALEDKFNDWASRKLFLIADEVVARSDLYHVKNKLKAFITGDWIRINPKGFKAYDERNHTNMVFLSNEAMPTVLEQDDRRHAVIWTPAKLDPDFYRALMAEIAEGGAAALHDYLLQVDLTGFDAGTLPPMTAAKRELIDLSKDSPERFIDAFVNGDIPGFGAAATGRLMSPSLSSDLYELYSVWSQRQGLKALNQPRFANTLMRKAGATVERKRYEADVGVRGPIAITYLPGARELPAGTGEPRWLGERVQAFKTALKDFKGVA